MIYFELVFKLCVGGPIFRAGTLVMLMVSAFVGGVVWILSTISKNSRINRYIGAGLLALLAFPYLVQYFVYRAFKIFYDLNTLFGGAGDALGGFAGDIIRLVVSFDGIFKIFLFFLPTILLLVFGKRLSLCDRVNASKRILTFSFAIEAWILAFILVTFIPSLSRMQGEEYNFQNAVSNFGLIKGIRLDLLSGAESAGNLDFENVTSITVLPQIESTSNKTDPDNKVPHITDKNKKQEVYGDNALDIDFASLDATGTHAKLNKYVASITPTKKNPYTGIFKGKNLIMISAEAFSAEAIDPELTPTLYRLATKGINFTDYYQPASAGTTGGEYQNIFGYLPMSGGKSFKNMATKLNYYTMGSQLDRLGYYGKAYHNNDYTYYDRDKTHIKLGYSDGFMGYGNGIEEYVTKCWPQSDLEMIQGTLPTYIDKQPFNVYYMSVSGHGVYTRTGNSMTKKNWNRVEHLEYSDEVKGYYAAQLEFEDSLTYLVNALEEAGIADDTVICISTDHFPYGLEDAQLSELYGYTPANNLERDHSRLILWCGELEKYDPIVVDSPTFSLDILPTLSNLFGTTFDSRLMPGRDVFSEAPALVFNTGYEWKTDYGTYSGGRFVPVNEDIEIPEDYVKNIRSIVSNKILYCRNAPDSDYFRYLEKELSGKESKN
ncbi:MAG: sulfatase-like hydrolase/transferase [Clostridia bacterium]|nr:sulfatase-like hydrolase/transferase [Clostridia bacterium]